MTVHPGHRVGIVGPNGSGKSSLFALLRGEIHQDAGTVDLPPRWTIAHVAQETPAVERAALDFVLDGDVELREVEAALAREELEHAADGHALAELHHRYEEIGGYAARARASELLAGLGVADARHADPVASFSGGWRMRLNLAQALAARSDLLLLDEPTNHLDLDAVCVRGLAQALHGHAALVTHDRDFLDAVAQSTTSTATLKTYTGNYCRSRASAPRTLRCAVGFAKQQRQIEHLHRSSTASARRRPRRSRRRAVSRTLERMERIAPAHVDSPFEFVFAPSGTHAPAVRLEHATLRYGTRRRCSGARAFDPRRRPHRTARPQRRGQVDVVKAFAGELRRARDAHVAQNLSRLLRAAPARATDPKRRRCCTSRGSIRARGAGAAQLLGGFDSRGDGPGAGRALPGEFRLVLADVRRRLQLLILDEPTNHPTSRCARLWPRRCGLRGALVVVAHDRHLHSATTDTLLLVNGGRVAPFDGDLDDYRDWVLALRRRTDTDIARDDAPDRKAVKRAEAQARQKRADARKPLVAKRAKLEEEIRGLEAEKRELDIWLATPEAYADDAKERLKPAVERSGEIAWELARREATWLEIAEALDRIDAPG
jgi:ATP-binding cassette subfamily F protein 3